MYATNIIQRGNQRKEFDSVISHKHTKGTGEIRPAEVVHCDLFYSSCMQAHESIRAAESSIKAKKADFLQRPCYYPEAIEQLVPSMKADLHVDLPMAQFSGTITRSSAPEGSVQQNASSLEAKMSPGSESEQDLSKDARGPVTATAPLETTPAGPLATSPATAPTAPVRPEQPAARIVCTSVADLPPALRALSPHVQDLLVRGRVTTVATELSPFKCVLSRHPLHRETSEPQLKLLVANIKRDGYRSTAPLLAMRYTRSLPIVTRAGGSLTIMPKAVWGSHPVIYVLAGATRGEAVGQLISAGGLTQNDLTGALEFHLLTAGEQLAPYEIFLLSIALNSEDPQSRQPSFFERADQVALVAWEISRRKTAAATAAAVSAGNNPTETGTVIRLDATLHEIAAEVASNPFLADLRKYLQLSPAVLPLLPLQGTPPHPIAILQQLLMSRRALLLPPGVGVLLNEIPAAALESLDVIVDMISCMNPERLRHSEVNSAAEGFLHPRAEDQLRQVFRESVPPRFAGEPEESLSALRVLVGVVFASIQDCSRAILPNENEFGEITSSQATLAAMFSEPVTEEFFLATSEKALLYWSERINVETVTPEGLLAGLWNFPSTALLALFHLHFLNKFSANDRTLIQTRVSGLHGRILYRCIAELGITLVASQVLLNSATAAIRLRVMEAVAALFRFAMVGTCSLPDLPRHPAPVTVSSVDLTNDSAPRTQFNDWDVLFDFIVNQWFAGLLNGRLQPEVGQKSGAPVSSPVVTGTPNAVASSAPPAVAMSTPPQGTTSKSLLTSARTGESQSSGPDAHMGTTTSLSNPSPNVPKRIKPEQIDAKFSIEQLRAGSKLLPPSQSIARKPWYETRRLDASATLARLRQEVEATNRAPSSRVLVRTIRQPDNSGCTTVEWIVEDPSILPMSAPARLEFLSLVLGVTTMLVEKQSLAAGARGTAAETGVVAVPANMIILAAIKVALTFVPPHFERLCPTLVDWMKVRCQLAAWMWEKSRTELMHRAEEKWADLMAFSQQGRTAKSPAPSLNLRFVGPKIDPTTGKLLASNTLDLTADQIRMIAAEIVPRVVQQMARYIENHQNMNEDAASKEFFTQWLRGGNSGPGDNNGDLIALVNSLMFLCVHKQQQQQGHKRPRIENEGGNRLLSYNPGGIGLSANERQVSARTNDDSANRAVKRPRRPGRYDSSINGGEEISDWLETLSLSSRARLEDAECPTCELSLLSDTALPDLLRWRPPESYRNGKGMRGPPSSTFEWRAQRMREQCLRVDQRKSHLCNKQHLVESAAVSECGCQVRSAPLSEFDWKVVKGVLRMLSDRGVDALVSRCRQRVFYLDRCIDGTVFTRAVGISGEESDGEEGLADPAGPAASHSDDAKAAVVPLPNNRRRSGSGQSGEASEPADGSTTSAGEKKVTGVNARSSNGVGDIGNHQLQAQAQGLETSGPGKGSKKNASSSRSKATTATRRGGKPAVANSNTAEVRRYGVAFGQGDADLLGEYQGSGAAVTTRPRRSRPGASSSGTSSSDEDGGRIAEGNATHRFWERVRARLPDHEASDSDLRVFLEFGPRERQSMIRDLDFEVEEGPEDWETGRHNGRIVAA